MKQFRIPVVWEEYGHVFVEAESLDDAIELALDEGAPLPEGTYVDGSLMMDNSCPIEIQSLEETDERDFD